MYRPFLVALLPIAVLAACDAEGTGEPAPDGTEPVVSEEVAVSSDRPIADGTSTPQSAAADDSECGADTLARWLNVLPTETVKGEIAATVGRRPIRYYTQGDPITMDFSPARLNVELGEDGRIKLFRCG
jgi:hypothetical protein